MSTEINAEAFVNRLATDASLQERVRNSDADAILEWAKSEGYEFTVAELQAALATTAPQDGELSDEQLGNVAGGGILDSIREFFSVERKGGAIIK